MAVTDFLSQEQLQQMMDERFGVPEGTARSSPLSFQYEQEKYPSGKSKLYRDREGPFSPIMQTQNPDAYYEQVMSMGTEGDPWMGARDYTDAPFAKESGDYASKHWGDYINYDETTDRPYQGNWSWQKGYGPNKLTDLREQDPNLMRALIRQNRTNLYDSGIPAATNITSPSQDFSFSEYQGPNLEDEGIPAVAQKKGFLPTILGAAKGALNRYNPLYEGSQNYNPNLKGQIDALNQKGYLSGTGGKTGPYRITGGNLAGQNLVSMFGTNDYNQMLQNKIDRMDKTLAGLSTQGWSEDEEIRKRGIFEAKKKNIDKELKFAQQIQQQKIDLANEAASRKAPSGGGWKPDPGRSYSGPELSQIGLQHYTGPGMAFEAKTSASGRGPKQEGGRAEFQAGGPPGGGDPGMKGTGQSYGDSYLEGFSRAGPTVSLGSRVDNTGNTGGNGIVNTNLITTPIVEPSWKDKFLNAVGWNKPTDETDDENIVDTIGSNIRNVPALKTQIQTTNDILANLMANESTLNQGGRVGYKTGGRVGILSVF